MPLLFSDDEDLDAYFTEISKQLAYHSGCTAAEADALCADYLSRFQNADQCKSLGIPPQDAEFFYHEGAGGMALRVYYYLVLKGDPNPSRFIDWRAAL